MNIIEIIKSERCLMCKISTCRAKKANIINLNNPFFKSETRKEFLKMGYKDNEIMDMWKLYNLPFFIRRN